MWSTHVRSTTWREQQAALTDSRRRSATRSWGKGCAPAGLVRMSPTSSNHAAEQVTARATHLTVTSRCALVKAFAEEGTGSPEPSTSRPRMGVVEPCDDEVRV